ncbi:hypothetical protein [Stutzerimonas kunmingensis]|uniref:hypothetical protein n=1 Tax=Stutzerimonas kunmingensis TaxID=1211807 RepID=UPI0028B2641E|nr:hypothetical protein [Stutzerimonas kunmingensis]
MNRRTLLFLIPPLFVPTLTLAADNAERLVKGCSELVAIYHQRDQKKMLAGWTTSASDALLAGYCRGVLDEFRRTSLCDTHDWHVQAQRVAQANTSASINELLSHSCGR